MDRKGHDVLESRVLRERPAAAAKKNAVRNG
jgi:hypothetical protein